MSTWRTRPSDEVIGRIAAHARTHGVLDTDDTAAIFHDLDLLEARLDELVAAFPHGTLHTIAIKANPLIGVLRVIAEHGCGLEAASYEEVQLALAAGCRPDRIVYDSPAKTQAELRSALGLGIRVNADSFDELDRIVALRADDSTSIVGVRINPVVGVGTIPTTSVAGAGSRFGIRVDEVFEGLVTRAASHPWIRCLHYHVGSQGISLDAHATAAATLDELRSRLHAELGRAQFDTIDIGGGATTDYVGEGGTDPREFFARVSAAAPNLFGPDVTVLTEFGRAIHANCGWALSKVEYVKRSVGAPVAVLHLGADFLLRPVYQPEYWRHRLTPLAREIDGDTGDDAEDMAALSQRWTVSGPLCFAGDIIARDAELGDLRDGDAVVIHDVGAYTLSMWSRHCSRGIPIVLGHRIGPTGEIVLEVLRARESPGDVVRYWSAQPFGHA